MKQQGLRLNACSAQLPALWLQVGSVIRNPEVSVLVPTLLAAIADPGKHTRSTLEVSTAASVATLLAAESSGIHLPPRGVHRLDVSWVATFDAAAASGLTSAGEQNPANTSSRGTKWVAITPLDMGDAHVWRERA